MMWRHQPSQILEDPRGSRGFLNQAILEVEDEATPRILAEDPRGSSSSIVFLAWLCRYTNNSRNRCVLVSLLFFLSQYIIL